MYLLTEVSICYSADRRPNTRRFYSGRRFRPPRRPRQPQQDSQGEDKTEGTEGDSIVYIWRPVHVKNIIIS